MCLVPLLIALGACNPDEVLLPKAQIAAKVPDRYHQCFAQVATLVPGTGPGGDYTTQDLWRGLNVVRNSELAKTQCGRDLIVWTEGQLRAIKGR